MEIPPIFEAYGLPGIIIAALLYALKAERDRNNQQADTRVSDLKEFMAMHSALAKEVKGTLDATLAALREGR